MCPEASTVPGEKGVFVPLLALLNVTARSDAHLSSLDFFCLQRA